jgi:hypothetical protein
VAFKSLANLFSILYSESVVRSQAFPPVPSTSISVNILGSLSKAWPLPSQQSHPPRGLCVLSDKVPFGFEVIEPIVNFFVSIGKLKQMKPTATSNGNKIDSIIFGYLPADSHKLKLTV